MFMNLISFMFLMMFSWTSFLFAEDTEIPPCLMVPGCLEMRFPSSGFTWLPGEDSLGTCEHVPREEWIQELLGSPGLFVHADGPSGSGRFWIVTVGVTDEIYQVKPSRGVCLMTSTLGWRTLQISPVSLSWLDDLDNNGRSELIIWSSFPLHEDATEAEFGLVGWVYRQTSEDLLTIDIALSRSMAREVAKWYQSALTAEDFEAPLSLKPKDFLAGLRISAAEALEQFADELCFLQNNGR